jgi:hemerythrin-like domain-containing protein
MKITKIIKSLGRTINIGNFSNIKIDATVEVSINDGESIELADQLLFDTANKMLSDDLRRIKEERQKSKESE